MGTLLGKIGCGLAVLFGLNLLLADRACAGPRAERAALAQRAAHAGRARRAPRADSNTPAPPQSVPGSGAETVHDAALKVTWLTNANLAATKSFGVPNIGADGSMDYATALAWVGAMNAHNYLGHNNWTLPTTPSVDKGCSSKNLKGGGWFGFGCTLSAMGSLYHNFLGHNWPRAVVTISANSVGPFKNLQPNLYWTLESSPTNKNGYGTFSFNTGAHMSNVDRNYFFVLPMIKGKLPGTPQVVGKGLQVNPDGETVYDPVADVTWAADANLAATNRFGVPAKDTNGVANFSPTGGITHTAALAWIQGMNSGSGYANQKHWNLPPMAHAPVWNQCGSANPVSGCAGNPLGELFYNQLHGQKGQNVTSVPDVKVGAFHKFQPYLYWSCNGDAGQTVCSTTKPLPAANFGWSFDFGDGFQGTDMQVNDLYVMVYYPDPTPRPIPTPRCVPGQRCPQPI
jgi:hypothetical protein